MTRQKKEQLNYRSRYLRLIYQITKYRIKGETPPANLLKQARELEHLANIVREEMENI